MITTGSPSTAASWRNRIAIAAGVGAVAVSFWLLPASVYIVRWNADGPARVALIGSRSPLEWLAGGAVVLTLALWAWTWRNASRGSTVAAIAGPLALLGLWAVPYLPWLPDRIPLLLVLAGPARWIVAAVAVTGALALPTRIAASAGSVRVPGRLFVFGVSLLVYLAFGIHTARTTGPGGDEPHYLMISQSLLTDHDLLIANNHQRKEYRGFYSGDLRPDFMVRGKDGQIYSIHAPGLPVLLLPAYAVAGYPGAVAGMCLVAALIALAVFDLAAAIAGKGAALFSWVAACLTVPFLPSAWLIYPELPGALVVAWAASWIWRPQPERAASWVLRGAVLATLPWFHTKFVVLVAIFAAALAFQARRQLRSVVALATPIAISLAAWLFYFYQLYGTINPEAPYGDYASLHVLVKNIPRSLLGLLFDQKFGLLFYSPIYLAVIGGCWVMLRRADLRYLGLVLLVTIAAFTGSTARLYMWWGGSSAPARFMVPLLPCFAPMIATAVTSLRNRGARALFGVWLAVSAAVVMAAAAFPDSRLFFSDPHGRARLLEALQSAAPLAQSFPTFTTEDWQTPLAMLLPWLAAAAVALAALAIASRVAERRSPFWLGAFASLVFLVAAGLATARPGVDVRDETAQQGALDLIWGWEPNRHPFDYTRFVTLDQSRLREMSVVRLQGPDIESLALPAGAYEARVWLGSAGAREGEIEIASERATFGRYKGTVQSPISVPFDLPASVYRVAVTVRDAVLARQVMTVDIVPKAVVPVSARDARRVLAVESIPDSTTGYIVYVDPATFPEGGVFWTRGTDAATVLVAPGGASRLALALTLGPLAGEVRVGVAGQETNVRVDVNQTTRLEAPVPPGLRLVPIEIQSSRQFHPVDFDPHSDDRRRLGCRVRIELQ